MTTRAVTLSAEQVRAWQSGTVQTVGAERIDGQWRWRLECE